METWHNRIRAKIHTRAGRNSLPPHADVSVSPFGSIHFSSSATLHMNYSSKQWRNSSSITFVYLCRLFYVTLESSRHSDSRKVISASLRAESWCPIAIAAPAAHAVVNRISNECWPDPFLLVYLVLTLEFICCPAPCTALRFLSEPLCDSKLHHLCILESSKKEHSNETADRRGVQVGRRSWRVQAAEQ